MVNSIEHTARRPDWTCLACGEPWPCDPAREDLTARLDRIALSIYAWEQLERAAGELPLTPPVELFHRFLKWPR